MFSIIPRQSFEKSVSYLLGKKWITAQRDFARRTGDKQQQRMQELEQENQRLCALEHENEALRQRLESIDALHRDDVRAICAEYKDEVDFLKDIIRKPMR